MYRLRKKTNLGLAIERRLSLLDPSLTGKMDPLPKLFVTPEENQYAMALLKNTNFKKSKKSDD
jgi:heptosyltransferase-2